MDCREIQSLIVPFIESQLTLEKTRLFLKHIEECEDCREELEVYYILIVGLKQLEKEPEKSMDLHAQFEELLKNTKTHVNRVRLGRFPKLVVLAALIGIILVIFTYEQQKYAMEEEIDQSIDFINSKIDSYEPLDLEKKKNFFEMKEKNKGLFLEKERVTKNKDKNKDGKDEKKISFN